MPGSLCASKDKYFILSKIVGLKSQFLKYIEQTFVKMYKSDLCQIFLKIPPERRGRLRKFVHSPYHNAREDVKRLFQYIDQHTRDSGEKPDKLAAHASVFPGQPYDDQRMRYTMSFLLKVVERFLAQEEAMGDLVSSELHLTKAYRQLGLEKMTRRSMARARQFHERSRLHDAEFYEQQYHLEAEDLEFTQKQTRTAARNLQQVNHALDLSYLARKLRQSCTALVHGAVANVEYDSGLLELVLNHLEQAPWLDEHPAISLYFYFYRAAATGDEVWFAKLKKGIVDTGERLPDEELRALLFLAINFCIQQYNRGEERYLADVFELYRDGLSQGLLLIQGQLSRFTFKNIAGIAIRLGAYDWTENFINDYSHTVEAAHRRNYTDYNLAKLYHARRDYHKAMDLLQQVEYEDLFLNLDAKIVLVKSYFELGEHEALDSLLQSFQRFLQRKRKDLGYHRENYLNFARLTTKLLQLPPGDRDAREKLRLEISETRALAEREWLSANV